MLYAQWHVKLKQFREFSWMNKFINLFMNLLSCSIRFKFVIDIYRYGKYFIIFIIIKLIYTLILLATFPPLIGLTTIFQKMLELKKWKLLDLKLSSGFIRTFERVSGRVLWKLYSFWILYTKFNNLKLLYWKLFLPLIKLKLEKIFFNIEKFLNKILNLFTWKFNY